MGSSILSELAVTLEQLMGQADVLEVMDGFKSLSHCHIKITVFLSKIHPSSQLHCDGRWVTTCFMDNSTVASLFSLLQLQEMEELVKLYIFQCLSVKHCFFNEAHFMRVLISCCCHLVHFNITIWGHQIKLLK